MITLTECLRKAVRDGRRLAVPDVAWPTPMRLLFLAPHPDDFDAVGVTMRHFHRIGATLFVAVARTGSGVEEDYRPNLTVDGMADLREEEQRRSLSFFGLPEEALRFVRYANDAEEQPIVCSDNAAIVEGLLREHRPDVICLPHGNDTNAGHRAMAALTWEASRRDGRPLVALLIRDPKTIASRVDLFMPFDKDTAAWKAELLRLHDSQHQRNLRTRGHGFDDRILQVNAALASELGIEAPYAEGFEVALMNDALAPHVDG